MPRRRHQKNPLLPRIFAVAVLVNLVIIVVAAQFGAFKAIQKEFGTAKVVLISPVEAPKEKEKPIEKKKATPKPQPIRKAPGAASKAAAAAHQHLAAPHVVAAGPGGDGGAASGPTVTQGDLNSGTVPTEKGGDTKKPADATTTTPPVTTPPPPVTKPVETTVVTPVAKPTPKPEPKFVDCEPTAQPEPVIPDDLRTEELSKDFIAEFVVGRDGVPITVKTAQSTGIPELDKLALDTAKKWRFSPATLGGQPTEQTVRLVIQFQVQ